MFGISGILIPNTEALAQDKTPEQQMDEFKKQNKIRSLETLIASRRKDVDMRYAKKEISRGWDKKTKEVQEQEVATLRCPILYQKAAILAYNHFLNNFNNEKNVEAKIKKGAEIMKLLDKLVELHLKEVKSLEKSLKKDTDPKSIMDKVLEFEA